MRCPYCFASDTRVVDSRLGEDGERVRRRECQTCDARFTTFEEVVFEMPLVVKADGRREKFCEDNLRNGMMRALEKRPVATEAVESAVKRVMRRFTHQGEAEIAAAQIGEAVMAELAELDEVAYVRFASVYRRFRDVNAFGDEVARLKRDAGDAKKSEPRRAPKLSLFAGGKKD